MSALGKSYLLVMFTGVVDYILKSAVVGALGWFFLAIVFRRVDASLTSFFEIWGVTYIALLAIGSLLKTAVHLRILILTLIQSQRLNLSYNDLVLAFVVLKLDRKIPVFDWSAGWVLSEIEAYRLRRRKAAERAKEWRKLFDF